MRRLILPPPEDSFPGDVDRIIDACAKNNFSIDRETAIRAWMAYSESLCAGWIMMFDEDHHIIEAILSVCDIVDV